MKRTYHLTSEQTQRALRQERERRLFREMFMSDGAPDYDADGIPSEAMRTYAELCFEQVKENLAAGRAVFGWQRPDPIHTLRRAMGVEAEEEGSEGDDAEGRE